jgi:hypothetical protein
LEIPEEAKLAIWAAIASFVTFLLGYIKRRLESRKGHFEPILSGASAIENILSTFTVDLGAKFSFIVRCENGGEAAKIDSVFNSNAILESENEFAIVENWKSRRVDNFHRSRLIYILREDFDHLETKKSQGSLRDFFENTGTEEAIIFFIKENEKTLLYGFVCFGSQSELTSQKREKLRSLKGKILEILG